MAADLFRSGGLRTEDVKLAIALGEYDGDVRRSLIRFFRQSRSFDDRLPHKYGRVCCDSIFPTHGILKGQSAFRFVGASFHQPFLSLAGILQ